MTIADCGYHVQAHWQSCSGPLVILLPVTLDFDGFGIIWPDGYCKKLVVRSKLDVYVFYNYVNTFVFLQVRVWCLMLLSTIFQIYCTGQFYWWRKPEDPEKTTDMLSHWQTLSHNIVSSTPGLSGIQTHNVSGDKNLLHM